MKRREAGGARARRGASPPLNLIHRTKASNPRQDSLSARLGPLIQAGCDLCDPAGCDSRPGCRYAELMGGRDAKSTP